jgi:hypothetical protein
LKVFKWFVATLLGLHLLLVVLLVDKNPALFRGVTFVANRSAAKGPPGVRLAVAVALGPGPHLLVVYLRNEATSGWFTLETIAPGTTASVPMPPETLHPVTARYFPYLWRLMEHGRRVSGGHGFG